MAYLCSRHIATTRVRIAIISNISIYRQQRRGARWHKQRAIVIAAWRLEVV